jgi:hypothetical protein
MRLLKAEKNGPDAETSSDLMIEKSSKVRDGFHPG